MELDVVWTLFARDELRLIFEFHGLVASDGVANKIVNEIIEKVDRLKLFPESGQMESLLKLEPVSFRFIVCGHYKIIYSINRDKNRIDINDVFDSRQNPIKLKRSKL